MALLFHASSSSLSSSSSFSVHALMSFVDILLLFSYKLSESPCPPTTPKTSKTLDDCLLLLVGVVQVVGKVIHVQPSFFLYLAALFVSLARTLASLWCHRRRGERKSQKRKKDSILCVTFHCGRFAMTNHDSFCCLFFLCVCVCSSLFSLKKTKNANPLQQLTNQEAVFVSDKMQKIVSPRHKNPRGL